MRQGVLVATRTDSLSDLTLYEPGEGASLDPYGVRAEVSDDRRRLSEEKVTGQDGDRVGPPGVGALRTPAQVRFVHHVVVVQRGEMGQLDDKSRGHHCCRVRIAELRREHDEQWPEPLASCVEQMVRSGVDELAVGHHGRAEGGLDLEQPGPDPRFQTRVDEGHAQQVRCHDLRLHQRMNSPAWRARSRTGEGTTPKMRVIVAPIVMAMVVRKLGTATVGPSPTGSEKNISTMTRT